MRQAELPARTGVEARTSSLPAIAFRHPVVTIFLLAIFVRIIFVLFLTKYFSGTVVFDDTTYFLMAEVAAAGETLQRWDEFTHTLYGATSTLLIPVTFLFRVFGPHMVVAQLFVALLGAIAAAATTRLALEIVPLKLALAAGAVVALLPSQVLWSSLLMKDAAVWALLTCLAVVVAVAGRVAGRRLILMGLLATLLLILLAYLRLHTLVVASWAVMLAALVGHQIGRIPRIVGAIAIGVMVPWFAGQIGPAGFSLITDHGSLEDRRFANAFGANTAVVELPPTLSPTREEELVAEAEELESKAVALENQAQEVEEEDPGRAEVLREEARELTAAAEAASKSASAVTPQPEEELLDPNVRHLPRGLSVMLLEPFPVPFTGTIALKLARVESLLWYPLVAVALYGLWKARAHLRSLAFPLLAGGGILLTYALAEGNVGTAHRHRGEFVWVVAVLASLGLAAIRERHPEHED